MNHCERCGSYGINHHLHGRDNDNLPLCDVCFWRLRAEEASETSNARAAYCIQVWQAVSQMEPSPKVNYLRRLLENLNDERIQSDIAKILASRSKHAAEV